RDNPADVSWWAEGVLHLADVALDVGDLRRLVAVGRGAAYVDDEGDLILVEPDGSRTLLGYPAERTAVVSAPDLGLLAWAETAGDSARLVVWDGNHHKRLDELVAGPRARPITFEGDRLTFGSGLSDWAWRPNDGPARETGNGHVNNPSRRSALVDVVGRT